MEPLAEGDAAWQALVAALDQREETIGNAVGEPWNARDTYAHLARWQQQSLTVVRLLLAGEPLPPPEADEQTLNARWSAEDAALTLAEARTSCLQTRSELRDLMLTLSDAQWHSWGWKIEDITGPHYRDHL